MRNHKNRLLLFFLISLVQLSVYGQTGRFKFRRITPEGGITFRAVNHITQDKYGFMWFSTTDQGLIRYDSRNFVHFRNNPSDSTSLSDNNILNILVDRHNKLWVATENGLNLFIRSREKFKRFRYTTEGDSSTGYILDICEDPEGNLWIVDGNAVGILDTVKHHLKSLPPPATGSFTPQFVYFDPLGNGWVGSLEGSLYLTDKKHFLLRKLIESPGSKINTVFADSSYLYTGYFAHGARKYTLDGKLVKTYEYNKNNHNLSKEKVRSILKDINGNLWIGSYDGLYLETKDGKLIRFGRDNHPEMPHNSIFAIYQDKNGSLWFGSWSGGVFYLNHYDNHFINYNKELSPNLISGNIISSFAQLNENLIAIGSETSGLIIFNVKDNSFRNIPLRTNHKLITNVKSLCLDSRGELWVGTFRDQFFKVQKNLKDYTHYRMTGEFADRWVNSSVYAFFSCDTGIFIGNTNGQIIFYHLKKRKFFSLQDFYPEFKLHNEYIRYIFIDRKNSLWVGSQSGCDRLDLRTGKQTYYSPTAEKKYRIGSSLIYYIAEMGDDIWLGTHSDGINIISRNSDSIKKFDPEGPLSHLDVYGFVTDNYHRLWVTSNDGIYLYEAGYKKWRHITVQDGLQGNIFSPQAILKDSRNRLYFGGTNGFTLVYPERIRTNPYPPHVLLDHAIINNKKKISLLADTGCQFIDHIYLRPRENSIILHFTSDNYLLPEKNRFKYRLLDLYDEWIDAGNNTTATFTNLPSGNYHFEIIASNNDGVWNKSPTRLTIHIATPWYRTLPAYLVYLFFGALIIYITIRELQTRQHLKRAVLIEKIQREHEEELHEMKLRFFTNISHEFRTPLTLITGPVKKLLASSSLNEEEKELLRIIQKNTNRLLGLINQIINFRKLEKGKMKLHIRKIDVVSFLQNLLSGFKAEIRDRNIDVSIHSSTNSLLIEADEEKLDKILFNLISNAIKYSMDHSSVRIYISDRFQKRSGHINQITIGHVSDHEVAVISVEDEGPGMDGEELQNIFNRFEQGKTQKGAGSGLGLAMVKEYTLLHKGEIIVESSPGKGSRFSIVLPRKQTAHRLMTREKERETRMEHPAIPDFSQTVDTKDIKNKKILIVEDDKDLRQYIVGILEPYFEVRSASDAETALKILETIRIDLIISDVMMPGINGLELCSHIKSKLETSHIPIILLTALSSVENKVAGLREGADAYITKPFEDVILINQVYNLLIQRETLRRSYKNHILKGESPDMGSLDNYFLERVTRIIQNNLTNSQFSVEVLAREVGLHRSQLHRKLKELTNFSTSEYINVVRLKHASELFRSDRYTINEVAYMSGFNSSSYFTKCFKKFYGISPKQYIRNLKSGKPPEDPNS